MLSERCYRQYPLRSASHRPSPPKSDLDHIRGVERLRAILWARLALRINRLPRPWDRLLITADAATRLGASQDWLYRKSGRLPFTARVSEGALRYSAKVIDRWVARRVGGRGR